MPPKKKNPTTTFTTDPNILRLLETLQQQTNAIAQQQLTLQQRIENQDNREPHQPPEPPVPPRQIVTFKAFQNVNPPVFHDTTDPVIANTWIKEMERAFELVQLGDDQKMPYATYFLKGEVIYWWESVKAMEVTQQKFTELSRFVTKYTSTEEEKAKKFQQGLEPWIRDRVAMFELETYAGVVQKAALIENNGMQSRKERDNKKRKVPFYGEKSEAGSSQDRDVKRIGFQKGGNFQKKGNLGKRQESKGNNQASQGQVGENRFQRPECKHCGRRHPEVCNKLSMTCYRCNQKGHLANKCKMPKPGVTCYKCGKTGHMARQCKATGPVKALMNVASTSASVPAEVLALPPPPAPTPQATARTFDLKMKDAVQNSEVIAGTLLLNNVKAKVLIDSGATRSFISESFVDKLQCDKMVMSEVVNVVIANQEKIPVNQFCPKCEIDISGYKFSADLILFKLGEFDIILGMDWLGENSAQINCKTKRVYLKMKSGEKVVFKGQRQEQLFLIIVQANLFATMTVQQHIDYVNNNGSAELSTVYTSNGPLILVGEWVAEWGIKATKEDYQRFGSAQLEGHERLLLRFLGVAEALQWQGFKEVFYDQYFSNADREAYLREFHSIVQHHDESITDYMARFIRLAGFAGKVAGTAAQQADKFKWGLKSYMRGSIISFKFDNVAEVVDAAKDVEKERIDFRTSRSNSGSKRTRDDHGLSKRFYSVPQYCGGGAGGGSGSQQNPTSRMFALTANQAAANSGTVSGTLLVGRRDSYVLFDTGSTHYVVSLSFVCHLGVAPSLLYLHTSIATPMGNSVIISDLYRECLIVVRDRNCKLNLLPMEMHDFDIILGMDWLSEHRATIDCQGKRMIFGDADKPEFVYQGSQLKGEVMLVSALKASKLLSKGCDGYLAFVKDTSKGEPRIEDYPIVKEYANVFHDELPGFPPHREVEFTIELIPGAEPISKAPYRMAPLELQELKE
ncbi:hypothetical protein AgCh_021533 [Apium graveolens]